MATNLRLRPEQSEALRVRASATGRSQQELIRDAVDRYLDLGVRREATRLEQLRAEGRLRRYPKIEGPLPQLPTGRGTEDILDETRAERLW